MTERILSFANRRKHPPVQTLYLAKASNDLVSWCQCEKALASFPGQMDCPWCGCGWLFACTRCRKAFSFATAVLVDRSIESIAREDLAGFGGSYDEERVRGWIEAMTEMLQEVREGGSYVYIDGFFVPVEASPIRIEGWHSRHEFDRVPQIAALEDDSVIQTLLANPEYWRRNALTRDE